MSPRLEPGVVSPLEESTPPDGTTPSSRSTRLDVGARARAAGGAPGNKRAPAPAKRSSSFGLDVGAVVDGTYRVLGELGRGGMGVVLLARDERLQRSVALKLIRPELLDDNLRERFLSEARAMARICHPSVLPIYALGEHEGMPYFVSELVEGQTVEEWLDSHTDGAKPDLDVALKILDDTCRGVAAIHAAGTVHRDLKPSNLLLDASLRVRVADLGVADWLRRKRGAARRDLVGTPEYMAPETVLQEEVPPELAHRADVYSLGCLAFELLTGTVPFTAKSTVGRMMAHVSTEAPRPSSRRTDLPPEFDDVVLRALAKEPLERTPTADAFRRALAAARDGSREPVRILIADDDDDFCEILGESLHAEFPDAAIERAADGRGALEAFERRLPSVVILDLGMPNVGGMELTERLRRRPGAECVPIIVLTASGGPVEWKRLAEMGADGFLVKPVNLKDVGTLVRRGMVDRARASMSPKAAEPVK